MTGIVVAFTKQEDAIGIKNILVRNGYQVSGVCTSQDMVLAAVEEFNDGVVVCGYKVGDSTYMSIRENLPETVKVLLLSSQARIEAIYMDGVEGLPMPIKAFELVNTLESIFDELSRKRKKRRLQPRERSPEEMKIINAAKAVLMEKKSMSEEEVHKYIQKISMDSGTNLVEAAEMIIDLYKNK